MMLKYYVTIKNKPNTAYHIKMINYELEEVVINIDGEPVSFAFNDSSIDIQICVPNIVEGFDKPVGTFSLDMEELNTKLLEKINFDLTTTKINK